MRNPLLGVLVLCISALFASWSESAPTEAAGETRILDVPYVRQSEALCGGASVAMVLRYWGERQVYAEDFASLVNGELGGIQGSALIEAVRSRGWQALAFAGDEASIREHLSRGRPLIALIEDLPGRYHYVVLVGYAPGEPAHWMLHDPSVGSFRVVNAADFEASWQATGRWMLLVLPPRREAVAAKYPEMSTDRAGFACTPLVREAALQAEQGELKIANQVLERSIELCPRSSVPLRELAGVRLLESRFDDAARLAERAVAVDSGDTDAWRLLATSRFLLDEEEEALEAWAHAGHLEVDLAHIEGLAHTPHGVVSRSLDLPNGSSLTENRLRRARRRLSELPAVSAARVGYRPVSGGLAEIDVAVVERPLLTDGPTGLAAQSLRALVEHEVTVNLTNALQRGERWRAGWRWWEERPHVSLSLDVPSPGGLPGIWSFQVSRGEQAYGFDGERVLTRETRRHAGAIVSDWATADLRWEAAAGLDRWDEHDDHVFVGGTVEQRFVGDRVALRAEVRGWSGAGGRAPFANGRVSMHWRSANASRRVLWLGTVGFAATSANAPLDLWPGAGVGHARPALLRAHPLLKDGVLDVDASGFGTQLVHGSLEMEHGIGMTGPVRWGFALFTDLAISRNPLHEASSAGTETDVGGGLRVRLLGQGGALRVDVARGLRDGNVALSAAWQMDWPN